MNIITQHIIKLLEEHYDPKRCEFNKTMCPTNLKVIGAVTRDVREITKNLKSLSKELSAQEKISIAKELVNTGIMECYMIAYEFIYNDKSINKILSDKDIDDLGKNLDNWAVTDAFSILILGPAWRDKLISDEKILSHLQSDNIWIKRTAIVSTVLLNLKARGGKGDAEKTLEICEMVVNDHRDMIVKALSWALRELAKRDKEYVSEFLIKYKDQLHNRVKREVTNKLTTGKKNI